MAMASEGGLECPICCERYNDQTFCPRLLSCGHSFCSRCLERFLNGNTINCPNCRIAVSVPAGVTGLTKNFALLSIVNATPQQATPTTLQHAKDGSLHICEACEEEQHPATSCCLDCKEYMCKTAAGFHTRNRTSRDHRIVSLEELKSNPNLATVSVFCPEHNDQYRYFDEDCGHVVCRDCVALKHTGHKCVSLDKAASKYRQEMETLVSKADTHVEEVKAAEARVTAGRLDLRKAYDEYAGQMQGMFKEFHAALFAREQFLLEELVQLCKTKDVILTEQHDRLHTFQACLQSVLQCAKSTIQSSSNAELLVAKSEIVSTLRAIETQSPVLEPQADCMLEFTADRVFLLGVLNTTGNVSDKTTCAATTTAAGSGLHLARVGLEASFTITAHDAQRRRRGLGGDLFTVELNTENKEKKVNVSLKDKGNGTYLATYTIPADAKGHLTLSVLLRGAHIPDSLFSYVWKIH